MKKYFDKLYSKSNKEFNILLEQIMNKKEKKLIVTANPETIMMAEKDKDFDELLMDKKTIIVPDGVGIVKAANMLKYNIKERIPGVEIAQKLFELGNQNKKSVYLLGANEEVIKSLKNIIKKQYPDLIIAGAVNGYSKDKDKDFEKIIEIKPDIVMVALGMGAQEKLIYKHIDKFNHGIFIGVGGSFDVLSGQKKRAPKLFIKLNLEWFYRICSEPKRIKRFYEYNIKFIFRVRKYAKQINNKVKN